MNPILVIALILLLLIGLPRQKPGSLKRTSKLKIIARIGCFPMLIAVSWGIMFSLASWEACWIIIEAGVITTAGIILFLWTIVNLGTFLYSPKDYFLWKRGGGDPFFDTLHWPFNSDDDSVRYQELYREKARMENPPSPVKPDSTRSINDPDIM